MVLSLYGEGARGPRRGVKGSCRTPGTPWVCSPEWNVLRVRLGPSHGRLSHYHATLYILRGESLMKYTAWCQNDFNVYADVGPGADIAQALHERWRRVRQRVDKLVEDPPRLRPPVEPGPGRCCHYEGQIHRVDPKTCKLTQQFD